MTTAPNRHRPRGVLRRTATALSPSSATAGRLALARNGRDRGDRLLAAAADRVRQRVRPTRPLMRALVVAGGGRVRWRDVPAPPPPGPDGAVVRPIAVATCDLDRAIVLGATPFPLPLGIGHECVAEVLSIGERVTGVRVGQRVVVPFQISCGQCPACVAGLTGNCAAVPPLSMYGFGVGGGHWGGAVADELAVPYADGMLVPLPDGMDPVAAASVADTICDGYRHVAPHLPDLLRRDADSEVLIVAGLIRRPLFDASSPLYAGQVALALGARQVSIVDSRTDVLAAAERLGIRPLRPRDLRGLPPAPLVVAASATSRGVWAALSHTAPDGICSSVGGLDRSARVPAGVMYGRNISLHVARAHTRTLIPHVLELMAAGRLRPERVITTAGALDDAPRLLGAHYRGGDTKTVLSV